MRHYSALLAPVALLPCLALGQPTVEVRFSPHEDTLGLVLEAIHGAKREILVAAYTFTSKPIAEALVEAHRHGITVEVVADRKENASRYTANRFLANEGVPVRLDGHYPIHHNKFMVIDGVSVETGSFNYTSAAAHKNAENVIVLHDAPEVAARYRQEWQRLWAESEDLPAAY